MQASGGEEEEGGGAVEGGGRVEQSSQQWQAFLIEVGLGVSPLHCGTAPQPRNPLQPIYNHTSRHGGFGGSAPRPTVDASPWSVSSPRHHSSSCSSFALDLDLSSNTSGIIYSPAASPLFIYLGFIPLHICITSHWCPQSPPIIPTHVSTALVFRPVPSKTD